jgi:hypothetical protein
MIGALIKLVLVIVILVAAATFFLGYRIGDDGIETPVSGQTIPTVDTAKAREAGAKIGETVASGAAKGQEVLTEGALTAKIKSKMALDDTVKALAIDIDTAGTVVTLTGTVRSQAERDKAIQLARETAGVTSVNDRLVIR